MGLCIEKHDPDPDRGSKQGFISCAEWFYPSDSVKPVQNHNMKVPTGPSGKRPGLTKIRQATVNGCVGSTQFIDIDNHLNGFWTLGDFYEVSIG